MEATGEKEGTQIGILVPIESQRRTNGTSETGSSIKHVKAVPSKTKKHQSAAIFTVPCERTLSVPLTTF